MPALLWLVDLGIFCESVQHSKQSKWATLDNKTKGAKGEEIIQKNPNFENCSITLFFSPESLDPLLTPPCLLVRLRGREGHVTCRENAREGAEDAKWKWKHDGVPTLLNSSFCFEGAGDGE